MRILSGVLAILIVPGSLFAQERSSVASPPVPPAPIAPALADFAPRSPSTFTRVLKLVGGVAAGAWLGYMASQVAVSDWEDASAIDRADWAAGGAAFGLAVGLTLPAGRAPGVLSRDERRSRDVISTREIRSAQSENLFELVRSLRPEWLQIRGTASMRETPRGRSTGDGPGDIEITPGTPTVKVYLDEAYMGGIDVLRELTPGTIGELRFLDQAEATLRWGAGHLHGAIHVITAPALQ